MVQGVQKIPRGAAAHPAPLLPAPIYCLANHSKVEASLSSALSKDTTSELSGFFSTLSRLLNAKQGKCKYQLFKSLGLIRQGSKPGLPTARWFSIGFHTYFD